MGNYLVFITVTLLLVEHVDCAATGLCQKDIDCEENNCCATKIIKGSVFGICMPTKGLMELCSPSNLHGPGFTCGCKKTLTCSTAHKYGAVNKYRCVHVPSEPDEETEKLELLFKKPFKNKMLVSSEMSRKLLILSKERLEKV